MKGINKKNSGRGERQKKACEESLNLTKKKGKEREREPTKVKGDA